jgi:hypothetical protein
MLRRRGPNHASFLFQARQLVVTTAQTTSTPTRNPQDSSGDAWPVLIRLPDVSAASQSAADRPQRLGAAPASHAVDYRFDPPQSRGSQTSAAPSELNARILGADQATKLSAVSSHHLHARHGRAASHINSKSDSPILPTWDPFSIPGSRFPELFAPILSFLVLVALFTAAGTSVLMLRNSQRRPSSESPVPSAAKIERTGTAPTASGPRGIPAVRLEPGPTNDFNVASASGLPTAIGPTREPEATDNVTNTDAAPPSPTTAVDADRPMTYPAPVFPETSERQLPQAQMSDTSPAVARFSGGIQESPPRQAQHDDQSSIH